MVKILIEPKKTNYYNILVQLLSETDTSKLNKNSLTKILIVLLERNDINHMDLVKIVNFLYPIKKLIEITNYIQKS